MTVRLKKRSSILLLAVTALACGQSTGSARHDASRDSTSPPVSDVASTGGKGSQAAGGSGGAGGQAGNEGTAGTARADAGLGGSGGTSSAGSGGSADAGGRAGAGAGGAAGTGGTASGGQMGGAGATGSGGRGDAGSGGGAGASGSGGVAGGGGTTGDGFVSLFNGKDLTGWSVKATTDDAARANMIKVDNGSIFFDVDSGGQYMWLYHEGEYKDFHFKCRFQVYKDSKHNSGIQFRSRYEPDLVYQNTKGYLNGPQCDLDGGDPPRAQSIYDETITVRDWIWGGYGRPAPTGWKFYWSDDPIAWNEHEIIATGTRVRVIVNGLQIVDHDFKGTLDNADHQKHNVGLSGHFAFQRHTGETLKMRFKDIYVKDLTGVTNYMP